MWAITTMVIFAYDDDFAEIYQFKYVYIQTKKTIFIIYIALICQLAH
jgi:hypothetical protein